MLKVDACYLVTFHYLLPYTTQICEVEVYVCLLMYLKKTGPIPKTF